MHVEGVCPVSVDVRESVCACVCTSSRVSGGRGRTWVPAAGFNRPWELNICHHNQLLHDRSLLSPGKSLKIYVDGEAVHGAHAHE